VTDGERVVSYFGSHGLVCYDAKAGTLAAPAAVAQSGGFFGTGTSPMIGGFDGDFVARPGGGIGAARGELERWQDGVGDETPEARGVFGTPIHWNNEIVTPGSIR
jgi:hypothetical protein